MNNHGQSMHLALTSLKWMIGLTLVGLVLSIFLLVAGYAGNGGRVVGLTIQTLLLLALLAGLRSQNRLAIALFAGFSLLLFITGIPNSANLAEIIDASFAILGFVGLAGIWNWYRQESGS